MGLRFPSAFIGVEGGALGFHNPLFVSEFKTSMAMYTLMCIKLMTNKNLLYKKINEIKLKN